MCASSAVVLLRFQLMQESASVFSAPPQQLEVADHYSLYTSQLKYCNFQAQDPVRRSMHTNATSAVQLSS